jgi:hypothetical protein
VEYTFVLFVVGSSRCLDERVSFSSSHPRRYVSKLTFASTLYMATYKFDDRFIEMQV